jgi:hypothetical protein
MFVIVVCLIITGCKTCCKENETAGLACITCQPTNAEVYMIAGANQTATFHVGTDASNCRFAWYKIIPNGTGFGQQSQTGKPGGTTDTLQIQNVSKSDEGFYTCEIAHENMNELGDTFTRTRWAELIVYGGRREYSPPKIHVRMPLMLNVTNVGGGGTQISSRQLVSAVQGIVTNCTPSNFVASLTFTKDNAGNYFTLPLNTSKGILHVTQIVGTTRTALPNNKFSARWYTSGAGNYGCIDNSTTDSFAKMYIVPRPTYSQTFVIYFVDPQPNGAMEELQVDWQ